VIIVKEAPGTPLTEGLVDRVVIKYQMSTTPWQQSAYGNMLLLLCGCLGYEETVTS
jgi:hypothetical protein